MTNREKLIREAGNTYHAGNSTTNAKGDKAEAYFEKVYSSKGYIIHDFRKDISCMLDDVDYSIFSEEEGTQKVEVKGDYYMYKSGNMFVENEVDGWYYTTKADVIAYIDMQNEIIYQYELSALQAYIEEHECSLETRSCYNKKTCKETYGWLVKIKDFIEWCNDEGITTYKIQDDSWMNNLNKEMM